MNFARPMISRSCSLGRRPCISRLSRTDPGKVSIQGLASLVGCRQDELAWRHGLVTKSNGFQHGQDFALDVFIGLWESTRSARVFDGGSNAYLETA